MHADFLTGPMGGRIFQNDHMALVWFACPFCMSGLHVKLQCMCKYMQIYKCDVQSESYFCNDGCMCKLVLPKSKYYISRSPFPVEYRITNKSLLKVMPWHVKIIRKLL